MTDSLEERVAALETIIGRLTLAEEDFMTLVRVDTFRVGTRTRTVHLTHLPTGVTVAADSRAEGVVKLRKALAGHARRQCDLQEAERRRQRKTGASGAA